MTRLIHTLQDNKEGLEKYELQNDSDIGSGPEPPVEQFEVLQRGGCYEQAADFARKNRRKRRKISANFPTHSNYILGTLQRPTLRAGNASVLINQASK